MEKTTRYGLGLCVALVIGLMLATSGSVTSILATSTSIAGNQTGKSTITPPANVTNKTIGNKTMTAGNVTASNMTKPTTNASSTNSSLVGKATQLINKTILSPIKKALTGKP
jgi:hypothetical protein